MLRYPAVGRIVHVVSTGGECEAAIITEVGSPFVVTVTTFGPRVMPYPQSNVHYAEDAKAGSWHWPERQRE